MIVSTALKSTTLWDWEKRDDEDDDDDSTQSMHTDHLGMLVAWKKSPCFRNYLFWFLGIFVFEKNCFS